MTDMEPHQNPPCAPPLAAVRRILTETHTLHVQHSPGQPTTCGLTRPPGARHLNPGQDAPTTALICPTCASGTQQ